MTLSGAIFMGETAHLVFLDCNVSVVFLGFLFQVIFYAHPKDAHPKDTNDRIL